MKNTVSGFLGLTLALLVGCGYQFQVEGAGPVVGGGAARADATLKGPPPKLAIQPFENRSFEPKLETKYTAYTRQELASGGGVEVVNEKTQAELVFKAQITSAVTPSLSFTQGFTFESRVIVTVAASVHDLRTGQEVWKTQTTGTSEFFLTNDLQFNRNLQDRALEQAGRYIAQDLATRFLAYLETKDQMGSQDRTAPGKPAEPARTTKPGEAVGKPPKTP